MKRIIINIEASPATLNYFKNEGYVIDLFQGKKSYEAVRNHPDLYMFYDGVLFCDPSVDVNVDKIIGPDIGPKYPENIKYNLAKVGNYIIGMEKMVPQVLKEHFKNCGYNFIDVNQGYAKCSTAIIDDESIITSDRGIHLKALDNNIESLLIRPGHILLPGLSYGFIGGCTLAHKDKVFFNGDIDKHPDYESIKEFIGKRNLKIDFIKEPLRDLGSFILV